MSTYRHESHVETHCRRSSGRLQEGNTGQWRWRLDYNNGNIIVNSGCGFSSERRARQGIESVMTDALDGSVEEHLVRELSGP
ncbi:YegP family protein [Natronococcus wangiae]|uniref:YegP family protein n=1 Tax=Natronococcus wangiae TaxID=3068275 RepID=UPI00273DEC86|nr:YegP family protein [Natronococcus sp. AD5]